MQPQAIRLQEIMGSNSDLEKEVALTAYAIYIIQSKRFEGLEQTEKLINEYLDKLNRHVAIDWDTGAYVLNTILSAKRRILNPEYMSSITGVMEAFGIDNQFIELLSKVEMETQLFNESLKLIKALLK